MNIEIEEKPYSRPDNIRIVSSCLTYNQDNLLHIMSADSEPVTSPTKLLTDLDLIDLKSIKYRRPRVGEILVSPRSQLSVFNWIIKEKFYDRTLKSNLRIGLLSLKNLLLKRNLSSIRIPLRGIFTELTMPGQFTELITEVFRDTPIKVTLCTGVTEYVSPGTRRSEIIENLHKSMIGGHKGINATYQKIKLRFAWKGIRNDVLNYVRNCEKCLMNKIERTKVRAPMILTETPLEAFDKVSIDTVGKLQTTVNGNKHILTCQCNLTKYLVAVPIKDLRATTLADALARYIICQFGAPLAILSDRGAGFVSEIVYTMLKMFKIKQLTTSGYTPWSNGQVERSHAPLADFLRIYGETYNDWDNLLPFATFSYNTSIHASHNFTPFELVYGKLARFPITIPANDNLVTYNTYLRDLMLRLSEMKRQAGTQINNQKLN